MTRKAQSSSSYPSLLPILHRVQREPTLWPPSSRSLPLLTRDALRSSALLSAHALEFPRWFALLRRGFSVLLSGFGSKKRLLTQFARTWLVDSPVVVVNGYCASLSARHVLSALTAQVMCSAQAYRDVAGQLHDIVQFFSAPTADVPHVYLVVHSLDGPGLRSAGLQALLSVLSALPTVHVVASVDHARAPLMWDAATRARFTFAHARVDTWAAYEEEAKGSGMSMMEEEGTTGRGGRGGERGVREVVQSLTPSHRALLHIIAELFITRSQEKDRLLQERRASRAKAKAAAAVVEETKEERPSPEEADAASTSRLVLISFADIVARCEEQMVGRGEAGIRGLMRELTDHRLVDAVQGQGRGGATCFTIQLPMELIRRFYLEGAEESTAASAQVAEPVSAAAAQPRQAKARGRPAGARKGKRARAAAEEEDEDDESLTGAAHFDGADALADGFPAYLLPVSRLSVPPAIGVSDEDEEDGFSL